MKEHGQIDSSAAKTATQKVHFDNLYDILQTGSGRASINKDHSEALLNFLGGSRELRLAKDEE